MRTMMTTYNVASRLLNVLAGVLAGAILTAYVASVRYPEVRVLKQPATSDQIRRGSGLSHELREHQARHPCGAGKDFAYHASAMELEWTQAPPKHGRICSTSHSAHQRRDASVWLNYSQRSHGPSRPPTLDEAAVLSWFSCGDGAHEPIEPLSGVARHPHFPTGCAGKDQKTNLFDITYLVLKNACMERRSVGRRNLFFDLGSSEYDSKPVNLNTGAGLFSSIPLFHALYARNCIMFHSIFAWEYTQYYPRSYWSNVPADMKAILHFFNEPVVNIGPRENHAEQITMNALQVLEDAATPEDFVVMKVDIDSTDIEVPLVWEIVRSPKLTSLVDEILFEYHFDVSPSFGWGKGRGYDNHTVDDALRLMRELRAVGIRSHFWI